ncbi:hypothetical protein AK830_g8680 [Neonectria ditissima]|uniref:Aminoglycoside phosphotransferase domain-containing protein n=1 Tax=Neonectria ditissima TaxID=78410 RepID=A0A0P7BDR8_9HYPO|nr:hypothetical protein AK830_g8680 [Neonectria ditissima]
MDETTLPLLKGAISLEDALAEDDDILRELSYPEKQVDFWFRLDESRPEIGGIVSRHLNISQSDFTLGETEEWVHGGFNACIPIHIAENKHLSLPRQALIRFPLPYKVGEAFNPGNLDEKLRCEAATYLWLQKNCPAVPVPRLLGFGFPGVQSFTSIQNESFFRRLVWGIRYALSLFLGGPPSSYVPHQRQALPDLGYLLVERVDKGQILSETWEGHRADPERRANLFRDLSKIMLGLAKLPLPRIGSWTMDNNGALTLTNRPLTSLIHQLENHEIPTNIPRDLTYTNVEPYLLDLIACQDNRIRHQPNSVHDEVDGEAQLAALTAMRALLPKFTDRKFRQGPFALSLTDLKPGNIFVDDDGHITSIIDLQWACARPIQMLSPPDWLTGRSLEQLIFQVHLDKYAESHDEFMEIFEEEELEGYDANTLTEIIRTSWTTGGFWYAQAMDWPGILVGLYVDHILPRFAKLSSASREEFNHVFMRLWDQSSPDFISSKIEAQEEYSNEVREMFASAQSQDDGSHREENSGILL